MKKLLILLLISGSVYSQKVSNKASINKFLCKTWITDYAMMNGLKVQKMGQIKSLTYTFKADNTFMANGTISGKWQYNDKKKAIDLYLNNVLKSTITSLQNKKMTMVLTPDKPGPIEVKAIEIHFKPKG